MGVSAGSIITGPSIEISGWKEDCDENVANLKDLTGLSLVPFAVFPHFTKENLPLLKEKSKTVDYPVAAINDTQAVMAVGEKYKIIGKGKEVVLKIDRIKK